MSQDKVNSYQAAIVASFLRERLLKTRNSFSFETVMSHPSKVDFLKKAANEGFKTYLYFICTRDPRINEQRVRNRVEIGGHQVSKDKIQKRYYASLSLLKEAFLIADRSFVIDSSTDKRNLILEKKDSEVIIHSTEIPGWVDKYLLDLIS